MNLKILVATQKEYWVPEDDCYFPLQVGAEGKIPLCYAKDNIGENISYKNANYCELTGLYWGWKNLECDYIGLCHYRRYFCRNFFGWGIERKKDSILLGKDFEVLLEQYDIILPEKRNYYIETVRSQYENAHRKSDIDEVERILKEKYPEYSKSFDKIMQGTKLHIYNIFVMRQDKFKEYCAWLFDILFELEKRIDLSKYDQYNARVFGFISERLFNVWLDKQNLRIYECPVVFLEEQNWIKKIYNFLYRKFKKND